MALDVESKATLDEVVDRAKDAAQQTLAQGATDGTALVSDVAKSASAIEDKIIAAVQPLLAEIQLANDNLSRLVAVIEKIAGGVSITFGGAK